ncbi:uncharacterized protein [Dysidea avara]|uniref:uncharacterized protein isoform X2 n=1 Tax=Dysidea avara TaxID=196820 RepID=UPI00332E0F74
MSKNGNPFVLLDYKRGNRIWAVILRMIYVSWLFDSVLSTNITITSSPQLGVDTVCDNQDVTLMCHTDQTTGNMITWYWSNQSQHGDTITVVARMTGVVYTCVVSNNGKDMGDAKVTVVANESSPQVDGYNFNSYILKYERNNLTLITEIFSDLPLSSDDIKWVGFHRPLPSTAVVDNYTIDGVLYSRLSLYELSFEDDSGNYTNIVSNQCGTSSVSVYIDVRKAPIVCNNSGSVAVPQKNIMTVKGESIVLQCLFKGNLKILWPSMSIYWMIGSHDQQTQDMYIMDNSTDPYRIAVYQTCLNEDGSCCNFTNKLTIPKVPLELNGVHLECGEVLDEITYSHSTELTVFKYPRLKSPSHRDIWATLNNTKMLQCHVYAPEMTGVTIMMWLKDHIPINSSEHYSIEDTAPPGIGVVTSTLTIDSVTEEDEGTFSCYCHYNETMVTSDKPVISAFSNIHLHIGEGGRGGDNGPSLTLYAMIMIIGCLVGILFVAVGTAVYFVRRNTIVQRQQRQQQQQQQQPPQQQQQPPPPPQQQQQHQEEDQQQQEQRQLPIADDENQPLLAEDFTVQVPIDATADYGTFHGEAEESTSASQFVSLPPHPNSGDRTMENLVINQVTNDDL